MTATKFSAVVLLMTLVVQAPTYALNIIATSPTPSDGTQPNTFMATSNSIGSSLLGSGVPAVLLLIVKSADVTTLCQQIVGTGSLSFSITITDSASGTTDDLNAQVESIGGCEAAPDESGTEAVFLDNYGRRSALVCPANAGSNGCGVYFTSQDMTNLYNQVASGSNVPTTGSRKLLDDVCGAYGLYDGILLTTGIGTIINEAICLALGPAYPLCLLALSLGEPLVAVVAGSAACYIATNTKSCFPGDATVSMASGGMKRMDQLDLGDKVAVWKPDGGIAYEDVYAFGHRNGVKTSKFYSITMAPTSITSATKLETRLELSGLHFAPILLGGIGGQEIVYVRAQQIKVGDMMWALDNKALALHNVTGLSISRKRGLYNPFTMTGTIVVNNVAASVHSDWFLDDVFDIVGLTHFLPLAYQVILAPPRMLYRALGKTFYVILYNWLDFHTNLVEYVSDYSGSVAVVVVTCIVVAPFYLSKRST